MGHGGKVAGGLPVGWAERFGALDRLYGAGTMARLAACHVAVVGVGGVGCWAVEALARSGVGKLTLIDLDDLCVTNTNRQIHALEGTVGLPKVRAMGERVRQISPGCEVVEEAAYFGESTAERLLEGRGYDGVIDAIDGARAKALLVARVNRLGLRLVSCGGAGGKTRAECVRIDDIALAINDPLLRRVRALLREEHGFPDEDRVPFGVRAVFSTERPSYPWADGTMGRSAEPGSSLSLDCRSGFGTSTQVVGAFGFAAAGEMVGDLVLSP